MVDINQKERTIRVKIVYYGPALGGKTTNLRVLHEQALAARRGELISVNSMQDRTILCDLLPLHSGGFRGYDLKLQLLAVPGQSMYSATRRVVLKAADGVVFVANSASDRWYENTQSLKEMNANLVAHQVDPHTIPLVIQYNKRDLPQVIDLAALGRELNVRHVPSFPSVATKGSGVLETLAAILSVTLQDLCRRYRTMELPPGQTLDAWVKQAVKGMFGREQLEAPPTEAPVQAHEEPEEPPVEIELPDGTTMAVASTGYRRVRVTTPEDAPRSPAPAAPEPRVPQPRPAEARPPETRPAEAHPPETLAASYAEATAELGFVVNDLREELTAALVRLKEMRHALELATEPHGSADVEARVRRILQVLVSAGGASAAALRLATSEAARNVTLPPLVSDPLSRTTWGQAHLDELRDLPEPLVEEAVESPQLTDALRASEPSFEAVVLVPLRSAERLLGLALLYYDVHAALPSRDTQLHLGYLARELAGPLEASAAREATAAARRLRVLSQAAAAGVASLLTRLPPEAVRRQQLDLAGVLAPLRVPGLLVEAPAEAIAVVGDAPLLRFTLATLVHLCETDALERDQTPEITVRAVVDGAAVRVAISAVGRSSVLAAGDPGHDLSDAELSVVQMIAALHEGAVTHSRGADQRPEFVLELKRA